MNLATLRKLFEQVRQKKLSADEAVERLRHFPFEDLGFAKVLRQPVRSSAREEPSGRGYFHQLASRRKCGDAGGGRYEAVVAQREKAEYCPLARAIIYTCDRKRYGKGRLR